MSALPSHGARRALVLSIVLSVLGYAGFSVWAGWREVTALIFELGLAGIGLMLILSGVNYGLRFLRWQILLARLGHRVPAAPGALIYVAGFALTTTPGKAGEAIRSIFLKAHGVGYHASLAALFSERLSDLIAVVLLACLGATSHPSSRPVVGGVLLLIVLLLLTLALSERLRPLHARLQASGGKLGALGARLCELMFSAASCHRPGILLATTAVSVLAWGAEAWAFHLMLEGMGLSLQAIWAFFVYALSMLVGAISFLPGGLGSAEATMVGLLIGAGQTEASAVAATLLIRLTTLWFAVALGAWALAVVSRARPATALGPQP
ncbi:flippase-like domain-containing protein [Piscinibacter sp. SJAQ100]|uniref:Flippase-like domain-containing protein n=1 Tax=Aquariibacter albus TaxID=2759899 RepID=A0A839HGL2_9BURK|nr:flippase-like domain-containing protein [Aquariibacter albus]